VTLTRTGAADQVLADHGAGGFAAVLPLPGTSRTSATWPDPGAVTLTRTGAADQVLGRSRLVNADGGGSGAAVSSPRLG